MGSPIRFADFKRKFEAFGCSIEPGGKHFILSRPYKGVVLKYPIPTKKGRWVLDIYVKKARRAMKLTPDDGVSDEDFDNA